MNWYSVMTVFNGLISAALAIVVFLLLQSKVEDIKDAAQRRRDREALEERAAQIKPGEVYRFIVTGNPLQDDRYIDYLVKEVKDGYVGFVHLEYPNTKMSVERSTEFLRRRVKVQ